MESEQNHTEDDPQHSMAVAQVNAFIDASAKWVRLNPDQKYLEHTMRRKLARQLNNTPQQRLSPSLIRSLVVHEVANGGPSDKELATAAVCELADRTEARNWSRSGIRLLFPKAPVGSAK